MEQAREQLVAEVQLGGWLSVFPETGGQVQVAYVPANPELVMPAGRRFNELRDDLLRDSEQLPDAGPVRPSPEYLRMFDKRQLVLERVDAEGRRHPQVFHGDTHAGWAVTDWLRRETSK